MTNYKVNVRGEKEVHQVELSIVSLMFYDTVHADISRICGDFAAFQYEDEDGDVITVKCDADLDGFRTVLDKTASPTIISLVKPIDNFSEIAVVLPTDLQHLDVISSGQFGTVFRSLHLPTDQVVAVKCVEISGDDEEREVQKEIKLMKQCDTCEFIVQLKGASFDANVFLICLEFMDGGSVSNYGPFPSEILQHVSLSIFEGLKFMWNKKIMHRDLKPANVLVNYQGYVKLTDFGLSKEMDHSIARSFVGTSAYMAPERIQGGEYRLESDIWSFGLTIWELAIGKFPIDYNLFGNAWQNVFSAKRISLVNFERRLADLITNCVAGEVSERWGFSQLQSSLFFPIQLNRTCIAIFLRQK